MLLKKDPLKRESSEVREVQKMLNKALDNAKLLATADSSLPSLPPMLGEYHMMQDSNLHHKKDVPIGWNIIQEDGIFWTETENAVICFKDFFYLAREIDAGIVGDTTYSKLKELSSINSCDIQILGLPTQNSKDRYLEDEKMIFDFLRRVSDVGKIGIKLVDDILKERDSKIDTLNRAEKDTTKVYEKFENKKNKQQTKNPNQEVKLKKGTIQGYMNKVHKIITQNGYVFPDFSNYKPNTAQCDEFFEAVKSLLLEKRNTINKAYVTVNKISEILGPFRKICDKIPGLKWFLCFDYVHRATLYLIDGDIEKCKEELYMAAWYLFENIITDFFLSKDIRVGIVIALAFFVIDYFFINDSDRTLLPTKNIIRDYTY